MADHESDKFLTTREAADIVGLNRGTLANYRQRGIGPAYYKIRSSVRYRMEDLQNWREARQKKPAGPARSATGTRPDCPIVAAPRDLQTVGRDRDDPGAPASRRRGRLAKARGSGDD